MKKIVLITLSLLLALSFWNCEKDDICPEGTPATPRLIIEFYDAANPTVLKNVTNLRVQGLGAVNPLVFNENFEETGSGFLAALKENNEVLKNRPMYNQKLIENKVYPYGLYYLESKRGYSRLEIGKTRKVAPVLKFKTKERAREILEKVMQNYSLCKQVNAGIKSEDSCFQYKINECKGACVKKEEREVYNRRIAEFIKTTEYPSSTFLILDKGRKGIEKSFYLIEDNIFKGFGYYEYHHQIKSLDKIHHVLIEIEETEEIRNMLKYFLYKISSNPTQLIILE